MVSRVFPPDEGGVQTYARSLALAYQELGCEVEVFTKTSQGPRRLQDRGLRIVDVGDGSKPVVYGRLLWALARAAVSAWWQRQLPSVIHAATWRAAIPLCLLGLGRWSSVSTDARSAGHVAWAAG